MELHASWNTDLLEKLVVSQLVKKFLHHVHGLKMN
jgi:hypothetical protein